MANIEKSIQWFKDHHHSKGYHYSMTQRYGNPNFDCSSAVFYALIAGGFLDKNQSIGNTETLFALARQGKFKEVYNYSEIQKGDIFIRGGEGTSAGAGGHTGMFIDKSTIIHSNYTNDGISINGADTIGYFLDRRRTTNERYFRPVDPNNKSNKPVSKPRPQPSGKPRLVKYENWHGITQTVCNVRSYPSTDAPIVATYGNNQTIYYDRVYEFDGYYWISYIGYSGKRRYVAYRLASDVNSNWIIF